MDGLSGFLVCCLMITFFAQASNQVYLQASLDPALWLGVSKKAGNLQRVLQT